MNSSRTLAPGRTEVSAGVNLKNKRVSYFTSKMSLGLAEEWQFGTCGYSKA